MTDQPHTPTTEQVREAFSAPWHEPEGHDIGEYGTAFDRWLATVEAAAEQRGAERDLLEASDAIRGNEAICANCAIIAADHLLDRADQMEGDDEELDQVKTAWRKANRNIAKMWKQLDEAFDAGTGSVGSGRVAVSKKGNDRFVHLPSGRALAYRGVRRTKVQKTWPDGDTSIINALQFRGDYGPVQTYGGKLTENVTQAIARDILAESMLALERQGMKIVGHVHDEVIIEDPDSKVDVADVERRMSVPPKWAKDLPLGAEGFRTYRYKKG